MGANCERKNSDQTVAYIEDMLVELRTMSQQAGEPMLTYFIEMAMVEAADIVAGREKAPADRADMPPNVIAGLFDNQSLK